MAQQETGPLTPHAFFNIVPSYKGLALHPFVRQRVIPALEKTHPREMSMFKQKYMRNIVNAKLSSLEKQSRVYSLAIWEMMNLSIKHRGADRGLSFGLFSGGAYRYYVWDNLSKNFYPSQGFEFDLPLAYKPEPLDRPHDGEVHFKGKLSSATRGGGSYLALRLYFHVGDEKERRDPGETRQSENVGIVCEVPYFFLRSDRYETFQNQEVMQRLLETFGLREERMDMDLDFIPTDELGESTFLSESPATVIGNDYMTVYIR